MTQTVKPGRVIRVKNDAGTLSGIEGQEFVVIECPKHKDHLNLKPGTAWILVGGIPKFLVSERFDVVSVAIKVGTRLRVHSNCGYLEGISGQEFTTIECPSHQIDQGHEDQPWILYKGMQYFIPAGKYDVISTTEPSSEVCEDCNGAGEIVLFTSTVKCGCFLGRSQND